MTKRAKIIVAIAVLVLLAVGTVMFLSARSKTPAPASAQAASSSAPTNAEPFVTPTAMSADQASAQDVATAFIQAYASSSFEDADSSTWLRRALPHTTKEYGQKLSAQFGGAGGGASWEEFKTQKQHRRAAEVKVTRFPDNPELYMVEYQDETLEKSTVLTTEPAIKVLTMRQVAGAWRVAGMVELGDQPQDGGPVAPSDLGPSQEAELDNDHQH